MLESSHYRLAIIDGRNCALLVTKRSGAYLMPSITISPRERMAEQLTSLICEKWQIRTFLIDVAPSENGREPLAILEALSLNEPSNCSELDAIPLDMICAAYLTEGETKWLRQVVQGDMNRSQTVCRLGWVREAQDWVRDCVPGERISFDQEITQLNALDGFALLRLRTQKGKAYWLKATSAPNFHELPITLALAKCIPEYLPHLVASRDDWNAWVMEDGGSPIFNDASPRLIEQATLALANAQIQSVPHIPDLLTAGCGDLSIEGLRTRVQDIFEYFEEAMGNQTSVRVLKIGSRRLNELRVLIGAALETMRSLNIPDALIHNDINPYNILWNGSRCVMIDWAEACIGNPFLGFQLYLLHMRRLPNELQRWDSDVRVIYRQAWTNHLSEATAERAMALAPILTIVAHLCGRGDWLHSPRRRDPRLQGYVRSLIRQMDREANSPLLLEALCRVAG